MLNEESLNFDRSESHETKIFTINLKCVCERVIRHRLCAIGQEIPLKIHFVMDITAKIMINYWLGCHSERVMRKFVAFGDWLIVP